MARFKINNVNKNLNKVKIDGIDVECYGIYLDKDYSLSYSKKVEVNQVWIDGRDMPLLEKVRDLPIQFDIVFNIRDCVNFEKRYTTLETFLANSHDKKITFNNEDKGFKLYYVEISNVTRTIGGSRMTISFMCYPQII